MSIKALFLRMGVFALIFSGIVTGLGWLFLGKSSPFTHGVSPDANNSSLVLLWVIANFPAGIAFVNLFGKQGPEWSYFLCVFVQWLPIGGLAGVLVSVFRGSKSTQDPK